MKKETIFVLLNSGLSRHAAVAIRTERAREPCCEACATQGVVAVPILPGLGELGWSHCMQLDAVGQPIKPSRCWGGEEAHGDFRCVRMLAYVCRRLSPLQVFSACLEAGPFYRCECCIYRGVYFYLDGPSKGRRSPTLTCEVRCTEFL